MSFFDSVSIASFFICLSFLLEMNRNSPIDGFLPSSFKPSVHLTTLSIENLHRCVDDDWGRLCGAFTLWNSPIHLLVWSSLEVESVAQGHPGRLRSKLFLAHNPAYLTSNPPSHWILIFTFEDKLPGRRQEISASFPSSRANFSFSPWLWTWTGGTVLACWRPKITSARMGGVGVWWGRRSQSNPYWSGNKA